MWQKYRDRWQSWRVSRDPEQLVLGPWDYWRRSFLLLALVLTGFAFLPWLFDAPPIVSKEDPQKIWKEGRVGEPVPWGSTLFFHPGFSATPEDPGEAFLPGGVFSSPIQEETTVPRDPLPAGELARFRDQTFTRAEVYRLAAAEKNLSGQESPDRGLLYLVLQRMIESAWLLEEARLQQIDLQDQQIGQLLRNNPAAVRRLRSAGFRQTDIRNRARDIVLAVLIRNRLQGDLAAFEAEWVQRWKPLVSCRLRLPVCR